MGEVMAFEDVRAGALDYFPCRYGASKLVFRGPRQDLNTPYCAFLGGTETYGRFVPRAFPMLIQDRGGVATVNLGCVNGGLDVFVNDTTVMEICGRARVSVVQVLGAHTLSNRFYSVHPRRNDRFLRASSLMKTIFREVDFTAFSFTRHMLTELRDIAPDKFEMVEEELQAAWQARMRSLLDRIGGPVVLLWLADHPLDEARAVPDRLRADPVLVNKRMVEQLCDDRVQLVEVVPSAEARSRGTLGMVYQPLEAPMAAELPGPAIHREVAHRLSETVAGFF
ncbi:MAG: DUF6473 family protein [Paracoccaceae bacterium]